MVNVKFGTDFTERQIQSFKKNRRLKNGLSKGNRGRKRLTTKAQDDFILKHYQGIYTQDLANLVNNEFGTSFTVLQMKAYKSRNKLNSGVSGRFEKGDVSHNKGKSWDEFMSLEGMENSRKTQFKPGHRSDNWKPIGSERTTKDGYIEIKVRDGEVVSTNNYELKHRWVWEQHNGERLKEDEAIIFLDQSRTNVNIDNLVKVNRATLGRVNQQLIDDPNINRAQITTSILLTKIKELEELAR